MHSPIWADRVALMATLAFLHLVQSQRPPLLLLSEFFAQPLVVWRRIPFVIHSYPTMSLALPVQPNLFPGLRAIISLPLDINTVPLCYVSAVNQIASMFLDSNPLLCPSPILDARELIKATFEESDPPDKRRAAREAKRSRVPLLSAPNAGAGWPLVIRTILPMLLGHATIPGFFCRTPEFSSLPHTVPRRTPIFQRQSGSEPPPSEIGQSIYNRFGTGCKEWFSALELDL
ncbi:hypothetical protein DFP72DRAFT_839834 [Ephemerocybe angulata]|uniref:Uncharacterized protein n=1 Tax=Ephemerocybe angulata TaxID=980116 RepID=A0A8H6IG12_9AGAR|nr:hypothetical protein DFP72DRAFT_839834 [Tulosesus angulatus]